MKTPSSLLGAAMGIGLLVAGLAGNALAENKPTVRWKVPRLTGLAIGADGTVYAGQMEGLHALDGKTGNLRWKRTGKFVGETTQSQSSWSVAIAPDGTLIVLETAVEVPEETPEGYQVTHILRALDPTTGTQKWDFEVFGFEGLSTPSIGDDGIIYVASGTEETLYALDGATGKPKWRSPSIGGHIIGPDGVLYLKQSGQMLGLDRHTGKTRWSWKHSTVSSFVLGEDGTVFATTLQGLVALDPFDGHQRWEFLTGELGEAPILGPDGLIYLSVPDVLYALDSRTGKGKWHKVTSYRNRTPGVAAAADGALYVTTESGLLILDARTGEQRDMVELPVSGWPLIGHDGTILVSSEGSLVALDGQAGPANTAWPMALGDPSRRRSLERHGAPVVLGQSGDQPMTEGTDVVLGAIVTGDRPMKWQWFKDGQPIPGAVEDRLAIAAFTSRASGRYQLKANNAAGDTTSANMRLGLGHALLVDVAGHGRVALTPPGGLYFPGTTVRLSASPSHPGAFLGWSGGVNATSGEVDITLDRPEQVRATFGTYPGAVKAEHSYAEAPYAFGLTVAPDGAVFAVLGRADPDSGFLKLSLRALDRDLRKELWTTDEEDFNLMSPPTLSVEGLVLFTTGNATAAFQGTTGENIWNAEGSASATKNSPAATTGKVFSVKNRMVYALANDSGKELWSFETKKQVTGSLAVAEDGTVYIGADKFYALDGASGKERWSVTLSGEILNPLVAADGTVFTTAGDNVHALDGRSGALLWSSVVEGRPAVEASGSDGILYVGAARGASATGFSLRKLVALEPKTGQRLWEFHAGQRLTSPVVGADGAVYLGTRTGQIHALDGITGRLLWSSSMRESLRFRSLAMIPDGTLYAFADGKLYALHTSSQGPPLWPGFSGPAPFRRALTGSRQVLPEILLGNPTATAMPLAIRWDAKRRYHLEASNDLIAWTTLATLTDASGTATISDPAPPNARRRFYRLRE